MDKINLWLQTTPYKNYSIQLASSDASFREYHRLSFEETKVLLMDCSLEKESLQPFLDVTSKLHSVGVNAPQILEKNLDDGFLIIEDFGNTHYLDILNHDNFKELYKKAIDEILKMQNASISGLPPYDKDFLLFEMDLMQEWYMEKLLPVVLNQKQKGTIKQSLESIANVVLSQPQNIFVHRDYHSRNIMLRDDSTIGIIDYQDAMSGSITYDLVSLLKDCYIEFEREDIIELALYFRDKKELEIDDETFIKWFDFMGMQRHIKVLGVFARLFKRDNKRGYIKDIPLVLKYLFDTARLYEETQPLYRLLKEL
jgi:aminoglycoside/choline kinase family phosphotransferase